MVGAKVAVAPAGSPVAEKLTTPVNEPLVGVITMSKFAAPPLPIDCGGVGELTVKLGVGGVSPVPLSEVVCGEPPALSVTVKVASKLAADAGEKLT